MAAKRSGKGGDGQSLIGGILAGFWGLFGQGDRLWSGLRKLAADEASVLAARLGLRLLFQVWILIGSLIGVIGLLFWLIDSAGLPRGPVFFAGGALITLVSLLLVHFDRVRR